MAINPEWYTDPPQIAEIINKADLVSLQITRLKTLAVQLKSQAELVGKQIEILENARKGIK